MAEGQKGKGIQGDGRGQEQKRNRRQENGTGKGQKKVEEGKKTGRLDRKGT